MFCDNCGQPLEDGARFCPNCGCDCTATQVIAPSGGATAGGSAAAGRAPGYGEGAPGNGNGMPGSGENMPGSMPGNRWPPENGGAIPRPWTPENMEKAKPPKQPKPPKKKMSKVKKVLLTILILLIIVAGGGTVLYFTSPVRKIQTLLKEEEYVEAVSVYNQKADGNFAWKRLSSPLLGDVITKAAEDFSEGNRTFEEAYACLDAMTELKNTELALEALENLKSLESTNDALDTFEEAEGYYEKGDYISALKEYAQVTEDAPNYGEVQNRMAECREAYKKDIMAKVAEPSGQEGYQQAVAMLDIALEVMPEDVDFKARKEALETEYLALVKQDAMTAANEAINGGDYVQAMNSIQGGLRVLPEDAELLGMLASTKTTYEDTVIAAADELVAAGNYEGAMQTVKSAVDTLSDSERLNTKYAEIESGKPVRLCDLKLVESSGDNFVQVTEQTVTSDTFGNIYSPGNLFIFRIKPYSEGEYAKYYLGGEYQTLVMTLAVEEGDADSKEGTSFTIYDGNDQILYTAGALTRTSTPARVEINVSGQEWLYFRAVPEGWNCVSPLMADLVLYK